MFTEQSRLTASPSVLFSEIDGDKAFICLGSVKSNLTVEMVLGHASRRAPSAYFLPEQGKRHKT